MVQKLIEKIVLDPSRHLFNSIESVKEKLDYYRNLSKKGLTNLTDEEFGILHKDIKAFFNVDFTAQAPAYPNLLIRITFNKPITNQGRGGQLKKISNLLGPPPILSTFNRCNLPGESIFYCALDLNTATWETKPKPNDVITVSEWKIKNGQQLMINTVFNHPSINDINKESKDAYEGYLKEKDKLHPNQYEIFDTIIKFVTEEFIKPVPKDKPKEYLFSAQFASNLFIPSKNGLSIEAIWYPSIQRRYGVTNVAILNQIVLQKLDLLSITTYDVVATKYDQDPISNEPILGVFPAFKKITTFDVSQDLIIYP
jgi:hypothetical protein